MGGDADNSFTTLDTDLTYNGRFSVDNVSGNPAFLLLNGHTADFSGTTELFGIIDGPGTLDLAGPTEINSFTARGGVTIDDTGNVDQNGRFDLNGTLTVHSGVNWNLRDGAVTGTDTTALLDNAVTIEQTTGNSGFFGITLDNTGSMLIDEGVLTLQGTETLSGTVAGAGTLELRGDAATLDSGLNLAAAAVELSGGSTTLQASLDFAGPFTMTNAVLVLGGNNVTLTGTSALNGTILDAGTVSLLNSDLTQLTLAGGLVLQDAGTVVQTGFVDFGNTSTDTASLEIGAGKLWHIVNDGGFGVQGVGKISNAGTILRDGAIGTDIFVGTIVNTGTVAFETGFNVLETATTNDNQITIANGTLQLGQPLTADAGQSGTVTVGSFGTLVVTGSIDTSQTIDFATAGAPAPQDGAGVLALGGGVLAAGTLQSGIINFAAGDTIDLGTVATELGAPTPGVVSVMNNGTTVGQLSLIEAPSAGALKLVQNGLSDTLIEVACFTEGTRILTTLGEIPVEALAAGAVVPTLLGGGLRRVVWIGSTVIDLDRHPMPQRAAPIRIEAHAFGPGAPLRDLLLSPDHAVWVDGALVPIHLLINGASIRREPATGCVRYFHVELDRHEVLLAEGMPAESYLDTGNRALFAGAPGVRALHPDLCAALATRVWDEHACAVLQLGGAAVQAAHRRLRQRAMALGHRRTGEHGLRLNVDGCPIDWASAGSNRMRLELPEGAREIVLTSRSAVPPELDPANADHRRLGVAIAAVIRDGRTLSMRGPAFSTGFYPMSPGESWRWTDGAAVLRLRPLPHASVLELWLPAGWMSYWDAAAQSSVRQFSAHSSG